MKTLAICFFLSLLLTAGIFAQVPLWEIGTVDNQPYKNVALHRLSHDSLYVKAYGKTFPIPVDSLRYVRQENKTGSYAVPGLFLGMVAGGVLGNLLTGKSGGNDPIGGLGKVTVTGLGIATGGLLGMAMGASAGSPQYYNMEKRNHRQKIELLEKLIKKARKKQTYVKR